MEASCNVTKDNYTSTTQLYIFTAMTTTSLLEPVPLPVMMERGMEEYRNVHVSWYSLLQLVYVLLLIL